MARDNTIRNTHATLPRRESARKAGSSKAARANRAKRTTKSAGVPRILKGAWEGRTPLEKRPKRVSGSGGVV